MNQWKENHKLTKKTQNSKHVFKDKTHIKNILGMRCCLATFGYANDCSGIIQAHHLLKPYDGTRGMGMKSNDKNVIPLCQHHHHLLHTKFGSEKSFFGSYGLDADFGKVIAKSLYESTSILKDDLPF